MELLTFLFFIYWIIRFMQASSSMKSSKKDFSVKKLSGQTRSAIEKAEALIKQVNDSIYMNNTISDTEDDKVIENESSFQTEVTEMDLKNQEVQDFDIEPDEWYSELETDDASFLEDEEEQSEKYYNEIEDNELFNSESKDQSDSFKVITKGYKTHYLSKNRIKEAFVFSEIIKPKYKKSKNR